MLVHKGRSEGTTTWETELLKGPQDPLLPDAVEGGVDGLEAVWDLDVHVERFTQVFVEGLGHLVSGDDERGVDMRTREDEDIMTSTGKARHHGGEAPVMSYHCRQTNLKP